VHGRRFVFNIGKDDDDEAGAGGGSGRGSSSTYHNGGTGVLSPENLGMPKCAIWGNIPNICVIIGPQSGPILLC